jgi:hypothetical protein
VADTPVRVTTALPVALAVPTKPVADTPVTFTEIETSVDPTSENGAAAKEEKPNI